MGIVRAARAGVAAGAVWAAVLTAGATAAAGAGVPAGGWGAAGPPNIVVVVADDQRYGSFNAETMPHVFSSIVEPGVTFSDFVASTPLCCPFRATMLSGQYGHNNGVLDNTPGYTRLVDKGNVLPAWLQAAGYRTAHFGHYLNGYSPTNAIADAAPGWSRWEATLGHLYHDYDEGLDGTRLHHGGPNVTALINRRATEWLRANAPRAQPFYMQIDQLAPHAEFPAASSGPCAALAVPLDRDLGLLDRDPGPPASAAFDEGDVSDKPSFVASLPPLSAAEKARIDQSRRCEVAALAGVDRGVGRLVQALRQAGELRRTVLIYTDDNGFFHGEHRLRNGKILPYEEALRLPLAVRLPDAAAGGEVGLPAVGVDLAPTILDLAGAEPCIGPKRCRRLDGRSLLPLLQGSTSDWPATRAIPLEYERAKGSTMAGTCAYRGVRTGGSVYVEHTSVANPPGGECAPASEIEHYELGADPFELENLWPAAAGSDAASREEELAALAARLARCAGIRGRDEPVAGQPFCR